jgi:hypothetical protein
LDQVPIEQLYPKAGVISGLSPIRLRAAAPWQMPDERFKDALIDMSHRATSSLDEDAKVGCCTHVTDNARMCVALVVKCVCKAVNMWSAESRAQPSKCLIRSKMSLEQECSPVCD